MKERIINKVPHPVNILDDNNTLIKVFPKSNGMVRLEQSTVVTGIIDKVPITKTVFGKPEKLPNYKENVYYIVSNLVKTALPDRTDLLTPSQLVRDPTGMIVGCKSLDN